MQEALLEGALCNGLAPSFGLRKDGGLGQHRSIGAPNVRPWRCQPEARRRLRGRRGGLQLAYGRR
jgi:hypothetical protein